MSDSLTKDGTNKMNNMNKSRKSVVLAAGVSVALMVGCGVAYRMLAANLARPSASDPLPPGTLARMPMNIADWVGRDVPMDKAIIQATETDEIVNRSYARRGGAEAVGFYVAYGVRARDLLPHRPEVCYPGGGWTMDSSQETNVPLAGTPSLPCRVYRFTKSGLTAQNITVLNYYIVDGEYCPDASLLRSKAWRGQDGIHYMAQVQVTCPDSMLGTPGSSVETVRTFAAEAAAPLLSLLPHAKKASDMFTDPKPSGNTSPDPKLSGKTSADTKPAGNTSPDAKLPGKNVRRHKTRGDRARHQRRARARRQGR